MPQYAVSLYLTVKGDNVKPDQAITLAKAFFEEEDGEMTAMSVGNAQPVKVEFVSCDSTSIEEEVPA